jgi:two-component system, cell cycle sensor histidine kinase and response regulator CckA
LISYLRRKSHLVSLTLVTVVVVAIGTLSTLDWNEYTQNATVARHARSMAETTQRILSAFESAEASRMGYLLTGDAQYLAPVAVSRQVIDKGLSDLGNAETGLGDPGSVSQLNTLLADALRDLQATIDLRRSGDQEAARAYLSTHESQRKADTIRSVAGGILDQQYKLFTARSFLARQHAARTRLIVLIGTVLLAVLLLASNLHISKLFRAQDHLIGDLAAARDREERAKTAFETTLESIGDAVIAVDATSRVQFMNPAAERLTAWKRAQAIGQPLDQVFSVIDEATGKPLNSPVPRAVQEGTLVVDNTLLLTRDARRLPIDSSAAPLRNQQGETLGAVLAFRDVTPRREAQRQLEDSERRYRLLFDSNPHPMFVYEVGSLKFLEVNHAAIEHYGYSREEFLGMTLREIRPLEDVPALLRDAESAAENKQLEGTRRHQKKDGAIIYVEITTQPMVFQGREARFVLAHDVTTRAQLEEQLRQSQKLEAIGRLAGGVAHDFNNMLTVISGYADFLAGGFDAGEDSRVAITEIAAAAGRAAGLTHQLLAFSRRQVLQPQILNLNTSVTNIERMLGRLLGEDIEVRIELAPGLWNVSVDPGQIDQILMNLAVNARDAMMDGGLLTIQTENKTLDDEYVASHVGVSAGEYVCLSVTDTGHGMDSTTRARLFEPFFTTKEVGRGTGLGLSTVYGIVRQSHGNIWVYSEPGQGTTFAVYLPRTASQDSPRRITQPSSASDGGGQTILVVEDDPDVLRLVHAMLASTGYTVLNARSLEEARVVSEGPEKFDLLLCDMVLAQGDGPAIAECVLKAHPGLPVIFMSGHTEHPVLRQHNPGQTTHFLQKPFSRDTLTSKIRSLLNLQAETTTRGAEAGRTA